MSKSALLFSKAMIVSLLLFPRSIRSIQDPIVIASNDSSNIHVEERGDIKLLIHGWNADAEHTSMQPVRNAYLRLNVSHVVAADWREIAGMPYIFARNLIGVIGRRICELFKGFVARVKVNHENIHIVGHSLGKFSIEKVFYINSKEVFKGFYRKEFSINFY